MRMTENRSQIQMKICELHLPDGRQAREMQLGRYGPR